MNMTIRERISMATEDVYTSVSEALDMYQTCVDMMRAGFGSTVNTRVGRMYKDVASDIEDFIRQVGTEDDRLQMAYILEDNY